MLGEKRLKEWPPSCHSIRIRHRLFNPSVRSSTVRTAFHREYLGCGILSLRRVPRNVMDLTWKASRDGPNARRKAAPSISGQNIRHNEGYVKASIQLRHQKGEVLIVDKEANCGHLRTFQCRNIARSKPLSQIFTEKDLTTRMATHLTFGP